MAIVYCDRDGVPILVTGFTGDPPNSHARPPAGEAFSVAVDDDQGRKIAAKPKQWRYAGGTQAGDRTMMRYIGGKASTPGALSRWKKASNDLAAYCDQKKADAVVQAVENQQAFDVAAMFRGRQLQADPKLGDTDGNIRRKTPHREGLSRPLGIAHPAPEKKARKRRK